MWVKRWGNSVSLENVHDLDFICGELFINAVLNVLEYTEILKFT